MDVIFHVSRAGKCKCRLFRFPTPIQIKKYINFLYYFCYVLNTVNFVNENNIGLLFVLLSNFNMKYYIPGAKFCKSLKWIPVGSRSSFADINSISSAFTECTVLHWEFYEWVMLTYQNIVDFFLYFIKDNLMSIYFISFYY